ncbi:MAG TPA: MOSC domain-containing protein [Planctomycetaceae bacterium]|nr:MOSC domain-containing protein [Planctomycetaceae bacterium]
MEILRDLLGRSTSQGRVEWIGIALESRSQIQEMQSVQIVAGGVSGDHHCRPAGHSKRHVTLIQAEHVTAIATLLKKQVIPPVLLRRNMVVSGINLAALKYQTFQIGTAVLRGTGNCPPCSRMEENLGSGGYAAMLNHGGITAIVESEGIVAIGDSVVAKGLHAEEVRA